MLLGVVDYLKNLVAPVYGKWDDQYVLEVEFDFAFDLCEVVVVVA